MRKINKTECITCFLIICILLGIFLHIVPYFFNRSLWVDEAMLASSLVLRDLGDIVSSPLDFGQSAPVGWLYIIKLFVIVFGKSKAALRSWSLIAAFLCMILFYNILKRKCNRNYILFFIAIFSLTDRYIYYGNELKPYMSDSFFCLLSLYIWQKYREKRISLSIVVIIYSIIVWFSFSSVFFIASAMLIECISIINSMFAIKDTKDIKERFIKLLKCSLVLVSFSTYYWVWLSKTASNAGAPEYWDLLRFPLTPKSVDDLLLVKKMLTEFVAFYSISVRILWIFLFFLYMVIVIIKGNDKSLILFPSTVSFIFLLIASRLGFYPIKDRLVQVYGIVVLIFCCCMCDEIENYFVSNTTTKTHKLLFVRWLFYLALLGIMIDIGKEGCQNFSKDYVYIYGSEVDEHQLYLNKYLKDDELVYVKYEAYPSFLYENDYNVSPLELQNMLEFEFNEDIYSKELNNIRGFFIRGHKFIHYYYDKPYSYEGYIDMNLVKQDADYIKNFKSAYIYAAHTTHGISELINELEQYGEVTKVVDNYGTCLYHYVEKN